MHSGIESLIADPIYLGSGIHVTTPGGILNVHADFNFHKKHKMHRRVDVFIYLNPDRDDSYEGHLELWNRNMTPCRQRIAPISGRFVAFTTTDFSYHGHPFPLKSPPGRARRYILCCITIQQCHHL